MEKEKMPVLSVKYKIPSPRSGYIIRENLMQSLADIQTKKLTIIKAGAGSGKTTLLAVLIREMKLTEVRWLTLDLGMNQAFLFWRYLLEALEPYMMDGTDSLRSCFDGNIQREMLEQMIPVLASKITEEKEVILVLDDFQWIQEKYLLSLLDSFLTMLPKNFHLVILSREMPGIYLGSMYMEGSLLLIEEEQMRLSAEECQQFLTQTLQMDAAPEQLLSIVENANGWIGGAQLMAIAGRTGKNRPAVYANTGEQVIYEYIEREIFNVLSAEEQLFLKKTGVLSYFNEELCTRYLPEYNFRHMMKVILEKNLFVINIDEEKQEYRYHAILREFLLHMIEKDPEEKCALEKKAADICFSLGDYDESVRLLFECRAYGALMEKLLKMPQNAVTFSYMMQVPMNEIIRNVNFAYQYFFCYYVALQTEDCERIYRYIKEHMNEDETFQAFRHLKLFFDLDCEFKIVSVMTLEQIEEIPLNSVTKAYLLIKEAYFLFQDDRMEEALSYLDNAQKIYGETGNVYLRCFILFEASQILEQCGELAKALKYYTELCTVTEEIPTMKSPYHIGVAGVYIRQLRMKEAKEQLDLAKETMHSGVDSINSAYMYTLAEWYYIEGYPEKTIELIHSLSQKETYKSIFVSARLLRYPVYRGKNARLAAEFLKEYDASSDISKNMDTELLYAGIIYEQAETQTALKMAERLTANARKSANKMKIIEGALLLLRFLWDQGERGKRIQNLLLEALSYAVPEYLAQPFWFEQNCLEQILAEKGEELKKILSEKELKFLQYAFQPKEQKEPQKLNFTDGVEKLTVREREVLEEIARGSSNKEIAEHLCISLATVKTHLINIYGKLGVSNRMSAVNKMKSQEYQ